MEGGKRGIPIYAETISWEHVPLTIKSAITVSRVLAESVATRSQRRHDAESVSRRA